MIKTNKGGRHGFLKISQEIITDNSPLDSFIKEKQWELKMEGGRCKILPEAYSNDDITVAVMYQVKICIILLQQIPSNQYSNSKST